MTDYFPDASALVKRYAQEVGSNWVLTISDPSAGHSILVAEITLVEVAAALAARQRAQPSMDVAMRDRALGRFFQDCNEHFLILIINRTVIDSAVDLTRPTSTAWVRRGPTRERASRQRDSSWCWQPPTGLRHRG